MCLVKTGSKIRPHIFPCAAYAGTEVICVKKQRICSTWLGLLWVILAGTLLHFVYGWTGENRVVGLYAPVSESSWEHLKLLFTPFLIYTIAEYFWLGKQYRGYLLVRAEGVWLGMLTILSSFYTYQGILGFHCLPLDILTFLAGAGVCARFCHRRLERAQGSNWLGLAILAATLLAFGVFSEAPPQFGMFLPPDAVALIQ